MSLVPTFEPADFIKPSINVGGGFDIYNGTYYVGQHGEEILSGGLSHIMSFVGKGNLFKSTILYWMNFTAMSRFAETGGSLYDTEINIRESRVRHLIDMIIDRIPSFSTRPHPMDSGYFTVTDKVKYSGNKWFEMFKNWMEAKRKDKNNLVASPFVDRDGVSMFKMLKPTFTIVDSFTEFDTDDVDKKRDSTELGSSDQNIINMRLGLVKSNFISEMPRVTVSANNYMSLVAQVGKNQEISSGTHTPPPQQLRHMGSDSALKGVTARFTFAMHDCWWCESSTILKNSSSDKAPKYPRNSTEQNGELDPDLTLVKIKQLRSKNGQSGIIHEVICSQAEGVLPVLTEFHYISERDFGFEGNNTTYNLALYPALKLSRPTIRAKIDADPRLCRAIEITCQLKQIEEHWPHMDETGLMCTPKELYDAIKAKGYDWDVLLDTRGWWTLGEHSVPYLSTLDLLKMRAGKYHPYWYLKVAGKEADDKIIDKAAPYVPSVNKVKLAA